MEGRFYKCLARGHQAQSCQEPVQCRLCCQARHRQYACPRNLREATHLELLQRTPNSLYACLVKEITDAEPNWTKILDCIQEISPSSIHPVCHRLASGHVLLRDLSKEWRTIRGWKHHFSKGRYISWQRSRATDGAYPVRKEACRLELCDVPFGLRTWQHLEENRGARGGLTEDLMHRAAVKRPRLHLRKRRGIGRVNDSDDYSASQGVGRSSDTRGKASSPVGMENLPAFAKHI